MMLCKTYDDFLKMYKVDESNSLVEVDEFLEKQNKIILEDYERRYEKK